MIAKRPAFSSIVVLSLALAIGANTSIFSFVNATLLRPLPVEHPERLVRIYGRFASGQRWASVSYPNYVDYRSQNQVFTGIAAERVTPLILNSPSGGERILGALVSANYFTLLGVHSSHGRTFLPEEDSTPGAHPVVILSHAFWQSQFNSDAHVIDTTLSLNGTPFTIVGVAPAGFSGSNVGLVPQVWVPLMMQRTAMPGADQLVRRGVTWLSLTARLKPGVSLAQARSSMSTLAKALEEQFPADNQGIRVEIIPETEARIFPPFRSVFLSLASLLQFVVGLVLLVACANAASFLLARAAARKKEMSIRLAIGAGRSRLIRQLLIESLVLAALAGGLGLALAVWIMKAIEQFHPPLQVPVGFQLGLDSRVMGFTVLCVLVSSLLFGLAPALQASRPALVPALKDDSSAQGYRRSRLRGALLIGQFAVCFVLLVSAGLFFRSLWNTQAVSLGFNPNNVLVASFNLGFHGYQEAAGRRFLETCLNRIGALPGVQAVSLATVLPFNLVSNQANAIAEGIELRAGEGPPSIDYNAVGPGYFAMMQLPLAAGREFTGKDLPNTPLVVVVNETMAHRSWPGQPAIGKRLKIGSQWFSVIGVAKDAKYSSLGEEPHPFLYVSLLQNYDPAVTLLVRSNEKSDRVLAEVRREVKSMDGNVVLYDVKTMSQQVDLALLPARVSGSLLAGMGMLALFLAMIGLYGATAYSLARRSREMGIRLALGAQLSQVLGMVIREGMLLAISGLVIGWLIALVGARFAASLLFGVSPYDAATFGSASFVLFAVAFLANFFPALKVARIQPASTLRVE
jgi:predicted permease